MSERQPFDADPPPADAQAESPWFRAPDRRERKIAGWLFIAFGLFFGLLFVLYSGWWFRWVMLGLGLFSAMRGIGYLRVTRPKADSESK